MNSLLLLFSLFLFLSFLSPSEAKDCSKNCTGCQRGRCDVFGCSGGLYCCTDLSTYGSCCQGCGPAPPPPLPPQCTDPKGADCGFYSDCLEKYHHCETVSDIAGPKCQEYKDIESSLSPAGQTWSANVRKCLQKKIANEVLKKEGSSFTCDQVEHVFFDKHIACYLEEVKGAKWGFCSLPLKDQATIFAHGASILFTRHFWQVSSSGLQLKWNCDILATEAVLKKVFKEEETDERGGGGTSLSSSRKRRKEGHLSDSFPIDKLQEVFSNSTHSIGWNVLLNNTDDASLLSGPLPSASPLRTEDTVSLYVYYQVSAYNGPNNTTQPPQNITLSQIAVPILSSAVLNATSGSMQLVEYGGDPVSPQDL